MFLTSTTFYCALFLVTIVAGWEKANHDTLQLVQVLFRHGDRAPTNTYPNDPYKDFSKYWPEGQGQLTDRGKMQHYDLGRYFRHRYDGFLAQRYSPNELYTMSSDMDRTIMSAESNLAGLYPPVNKWNPSIDWQPIPIRTIPPDHDRLLHMHEHCPRYADIHTEFLRSDTVKKLDNENAEFIRFLAEKSGLSATTVSDIVILQDIFLVQSLHNLTVPEWARDAMPKLNELQAISHTWATYTKEMKRLRGGPLLQHFLKNMQIKAGVTPGRQRKVILYSAHDSTIARLMNTIGIFYPHNPPYAAALILELHLDSKSNQYFIEVHYRNDTTREPYVLPLPKCGTPCFLSTWTNQIHSLIPHDWEKECGNKPILQSGSPIFQSSGLLLTNMGILVFCGVFLLITFVIWGCMLLRTYRNEKKHLLLRTGIPKYSYYGYAQI